MKMTENLLRIT